MFSELTLKRAESGRWWLFKNTARGWVSLGAYRTYAAAYEARIRVMTRELLQEIETAPVPAGTDAGAVVEGTFNV